MSTELSERTQLLTTEKNKPQYVFDSSLTRERKRRIKQFQCCLCAIFLCILLSVLVVTVLYSINQSKNTENSTAVTATDPFNSTFVEPVLILLSSAWPISDKTTETKIHDNKTDLELAFLSAQEVYNKKENLEHTVPSLPIHTPSYRHQKVTATSDKGRLLSTYGYKQEYASLYMKNLLQHNDKPYKICNQFINDQIELIVPKLCNPDKIVCNKFNKYRNYDGTCNNLKYPQLYGVSYKPFRRALPPDYADGISKPRTGKNGAELPSARTVSLIVHRPYYRDDPKFTVMLAIWGQFLDHDITATALSQKSNGSSISCCQNTQLQSPECYPVYLDSSDPFTQYKINCMEFVRSAPAPSCCLGPRDQMNQVTPFIDGSVVYSADQNSTNKLRTMSNGLLKMYVTEDNRTLLPISDDAQDGCNRDEQKKVGKYCFMSGDARANENLHLTSMHLLWARQHNLLAKQLQEVNPHWNDERIFQEARRILIAQMQHITYKEFLPILLGPEIMKAYDLTPQQEGYFMKYDEKIDPTIANNFAAAAFRFAHTIIPGLMKLLANDTSSPEYVQLHKMLFNPFGLYQPGELDKALRGAMNTSIEATDAYFTNELKQHMFEKTSEFKNSSKLCGLDLVSLNIQRGRDHGLPGYKKWRQHCGLKMPNDFVDLETDMDANSLHNIKSIYRSVDDIDLYTGALSEKPIDKSILGPTITCLLLDQFIRIKTGDRFWYESPEKPQAFTLQQLTEIRKTSLANIICDNSDDIEFTQPFVMERIRVGNENMPCENITKPNINLWRENLSHVSMAKQFLQVIAVNGK